MINCDCNDVDESGEWLRDPCCQDGTCESDATEKNQETGYCVHCGAEMFKENGEWYHYTQRDIPEDERFMTHYGI